ncbi:Arsenate resistance protein ArsH [Gracilaria domingensis]|nr:Arsenate resistance protein ArsH [Gracilaria domingensis]
MQAVRRIVQTPVLSFSHLVRPPFRIGAPSFKHSHIRTSLQIQPRALRPISAYRTFASMTQTANGTPEASWVGHRSDPQVPASGPGEDWINPVVDQYLQEAIHFRPAGAQFSHPPRVLVLYGTLRPKGFSKLLAFECARILEALGAEVRTYDPHGLPVRDPELQEHPKVVELRELVYWSEAHVWAASELHGNLCSTFKNQIDWIPLNSGSVRPTQGKSVAVLQVNGGSQSFNVVNTLRLLARWMRMACVVNQSSVQKAWKEFDDDGRMKESSMRDRVVDVMEEFIKFARINREYSGLLTNRFSERKEKEEKGRLLTQAEKEAAADAAREEARKEKANE